jgi:hypothetical protein
VSSRHTRGFFGVMLAVVFALSAVIVAPASAKLSKSQKAHIRHQLRKQIKKNPKLIRSKHFIKKASLVNFKLPVTLRLRNTSGVNGNYPNGNPNLANVDLGASLGQRSVALGGSLSGEITFQDSYDGGALGNVNLEIRPSANHQLTSTSIPLLWNPQVSSGRYDANDLGIPDNVTTPSLVPAASQSGCGSFTAATPTTTIPFGADSPGVTAFGPGGLPGYPFWVSGATLSAKVAALMGPPTNYSLAQAQKAVSAIADGYLPVIPGVDDVNTAVTVGDAPGNNSIIGPSPNPFPSGGSAPAAPTAKDTVLRTNALKLNIAPSGTVVNQSTSSNGPQGSQDILIGKSGGQANLFGNIPGKNYGVDITVSLATRINSILRVVDQDSYHSPLIANQPWPAGVFNCRQIWTGGVDNVIPDVRLQGNLKIAPGLTSDGHLRIAKANVSSGTNDPARFAVAACLAPYESYDNNNAANPAADGDLVSSIPTPSAPLPAAPGAVQATSDLPVINDQTRSAPPAANCNAYPQTPLVNLAAFGTTVPQLMGDTQAAATANGYTTTNDGSRVSVGADLSVQNVSVDVLIGDV